MKWKDYFYKLITIYNIYFIVLNVSYKYESNSYVVILMRF